MDLGRQGPTRCPEVTVRLASLLWRPSTFTVTNRNEPL
jgi:hypothetical protein